MAKVLEQVRVPDSAPSCWRVVAIKLHDSINPADWLLDRLDAVSRSLERALLLTRVAEQLLVDAIRRRLVHDRLWLL